MLITLSVVAFLELRFMRGRRRRRESEGEIPDRAHNSIITTKAIAESLARGGVRSVEAEGMIHEAERAARERNFRVAIELSEKAKGVLRNTKLRREQRGDLAKLDEIAKTPTAPEGESLTEKERLQKELPANYMPSKFSMELAHDDIAAAKASGASTSDAERYLADAQTSFDQKDYDAALRHAVRSRRSLGGGVTDDADEKAESPQPKVITPSTAKSRACASCGAALASDDLFCRTCGVKVPVPRTCTSCGAATIADDDTFCRKCGTKVP
jgi:hypothetical protein